MFAQFDGKRRISKVSIWPLGLCHKGCLNVIDEYVPVGV